MSFNKIVPVKTPRKSAAPGAKNVTTKPGPKKPAAPKRRPINPKG